MEVPSWYYIITGADCCHNRKHLMALQLLLLYNSINLRTPLLTVIVREEIIFFTLTSVDTAVLDVNVNSYSNMYSQLLEYLYVFTTLLFMGKKLIGNLNRIGKNAVLHGFYFVCTYVQ